MVGKKELRFCLFVEFSFPARMRAGAAFKETLPTLDDRNAPEGVSGAGTCCWGQPGSWWVSTNTGRWKISVGEKDANPGVCHKTEESSVLFLQPLARVQPLTSQMPTDFVCGDQQCLALAETWAAFLDNFAQHHRRLQKSLPQGFQLEPLFPGVLFLIN